MKPIHALLLAMPLALVACSGAPPPASPGAPPRVPSPAELALMGPARAAEHVSGLSLGHDAARASAALIAAGTCPAADEACRRDRKLEALEAFATVGAALDAIVAVQRELAGPSGPRARGPDDEDVLSRLGLKPEPAGPLPRERM